MQISDGVFFNRTNVYLVNTYQYGMINQSEQGKDRLIWKVVVKYCNYNGNVVRLCTRAVHKLVLILPMNELHFTDKLGDLVFASSVPLNANQEKQHFDCMPFPHKFAITLYFWRLLNWFNWFCVLLLGNLVGALSIE